MNAEPILVDESLFPEFLHEKVNSFRVAIHAFTRQNFRQRLEEPCGETTRVGAFIEHVESLSDDTEGNEVVKRLQIICCVLNWIVVAFDDSYIYFTVKELLKIENWQYQLFKASPK